MKKTSTVVTERELYEMSILIGNTGYIQSKSGKTGLFNIKTNQIVGTLDDYYTYYDTYEKIYAQEKKFSKTLEDGKEITIYFANIYDAVSERFIIKEWELVHDYDRLNSGYNVTTFKSPDGKLHLYDKKAYRNGTSILEKSLEDIEHFTDIYSYFIVTENGKKGLYKEGTGLLTEIEYDDIERKDKMMIYTKDGKKYFALGTKKTKLSKGYDKIVGDNNYPCIYCFNGNRVEVYDKEFGHLLLETTAEDIQCIHAEQNVYHCYYENWDFKVKKDGHYGFYTSRMTSEIRKSANPVAQATELLKPGYDDINYARKYVFYVEKNEKVGLFKPCGYDPSNNILIEPRYDKIEYLGDEYFAFYFGKLCNISKLAKELNPVVTRCQLVKESDEAIIYQKGNQFGLFVSKQNDRKEAVLEAEYDAITQLYKDYFKLEKNGKVGVCYQGKIIIPVEYTQFDFRFYDPHSFSKPSMMYFALAQEDGIFQLMKRNYYSHSDTSFEAYHTFRKIEFLPNVMVLQDSEKTYIYDYEEKLLQIFHANASVSVVPKNPDKYYNEYLYEIDDVFYFYKNGKFEKAMIEELKWYKTTYENETETFEVKTLDLKEHDAFCATIDALEEKEAEQQLEEYSHNRQLIKSKYPTLLFGRTQKVMDKKESSEN